MKKVDVSTKKINQFAGKWVAIDRRKDRIVAVGNTLKEISPFVSGKRGQEKKIKAFSFKVPRKDEGPYVLTFSKIK
ncbi:hypothetical protein A2771_03725 [Candidatus Woesebacteria bacterium RIFCSPHIGHO2_01_FULL_38_26b]|uniref:Uncharacterized protein n=1 Tax=Candidatus Woesebacteria bacterium RIFCSPHIGHO2_01_FULL_38_26b TaxID=1802491 RepID=A0A1F7XY57_9BACT|nr:MAG: hypothetical protein A2771_03725 [Candidatus Woesebacteria bacterium RIFCSPHIGHO2_01_FULL_38_26b]